MICATNVIVTLYFGLLLCASTLVAQSVTTRNGGILYIDATGRERQITVGHDDRDPSLTLDSRFVVFVRTTKTAPYPSELWHADTSGRTQPAALFRGSVSTPDGRPLMAFATPQFSPGGEYVYFLAEFSATSHALSRLDVLSHRASFLAGGAIEFAVLSEGAHRGEIIASIRTASRNPDAGYSYPFYLLDAHG
jgi:hypothetical protein